MYHVARPTFSWSSRIIRQNWSHSRHFSKFSTHRQQFAGDDFGFGDYSVILPAEPYVFGVSHIIPRNVPPNIARPYYAIAGSSNDADKFPTDKDDGKIVLGGEAELRLREAAKLAKKVREHAGKLVHVGITTNTIDASIHDFILSHSAYPSPLHYSQYPRSCCTSVNNIIAHGIPDDRPLENGDIVNIDITIFLNGYHGDTSQTFLVGDVDHQGIELVKKTRQALQVGIQACGPGRRFKGIGKAIHDLIRHHPFSVSSQFTGHGIGTVFHKPPWILHHVNDEPGVMVPGDCFTIEPCLVQGSNPRGWIFPDGWTASTENCARSAQAEHMVLITEDGAEVLTE
ncbi:methionine aminopeptidase [Tricholoma matsutake]|nr:methionine aminopeptidase [Tricholoma matsutake 945]